MTLRTQIVQVIDTPLPFVVCVYHDDIALTMGTFKSKVRAKKWAEKITKTLDKYVVFTDALLDQVTAEIQDDFDKLKH